MSIQPQPEQSDSAVTNEMVQQACLAFGPRAFPSRMRAALEAVIASQPLFGNGLRHMWEPGERVELVGVAQNGGRRNPRPGAVVAVDTELRRHEFLRVRFDDGEERHINPDVMRHEGGSRS